MAGVVASLISVVVVAEILPFPKSSFVEQVVEDFQRFPFGAADSQARPALLLFELSYYAFVG